MVRALFAAFCITLLTVVGVIVFPLFASPPAAVVGSAPLNIPDRAHLVELLKGEQFAELDEILTNLQGRYEAGRLGEAHITTAFKAFMRADPDMAEPLKKWRESHSDSFAPHLAIGLYDLKQAWAIRGKKIVALTNPEQFKAMKLHLDESKSALWQAVQKTPKLPIAWATLVTTAMAVGDQKTTAVVYNSALKHIPNSSLLHRRYHYALSPKWGGSAVAQTALRLRLRWQYAGEPAFRWARFFSETERIDELMFHPPFPWVSRFLRKVGAVETAQLVSNFLYERSKKEWSEDAESTPAAKALQIIDEILPYWETAWLRKRRGDALYSLERIDEVVPEYARAIELSPLWVEARVGMTRILSLHDRYRDAHEHWRAAVDLDPYDPDLLVKYATFLSGIHEKQEAGRQLKKALVYGAHDDDVRVQTGKLYWVLGQLESALGQMRRATELVPENPETWYFYGLALKQTKSCNAVDAYETYLGLCRRWGCSSSLKSVAQTEIKNISAGCD